MKMPIDIPPVKKALGVAAVAIVAVVLFDGLGGGEPVRQFITAGVSQIKAFFSGLTSGK